MDTKNYWQKRHSRTDISTVGFIGFGITYNFWMYKIKSIVFKSTIKIQKVFFAIPLMLTKMFFWRLKEKYIIRDFHPLVLFYFFGILMGLISIFLFVRIIYLWPIYGFVPSTSFLAWMLSIITSLQFTMFAMWFDMDYNKDLKGK